MAASPPLAHADSAAFCASKLRAKVDMRMSALPPKADIWVQRNNVRFVPIADIKPWRELGRVSPATRSKTWSGLLGIRSYRWRFYLVRLTVKARAPSFVLNVRPELTVRLRIVENVRLYSSVPLFVMPLMRRLLPFANASSLVRSLVLSGIAFS